MSLMFNPNKETHMTRAGLIKVPTPEPQGPWHKPIPYGEFADMVADRMEAAGVEVTGEEYAVAHDGSRFFGLMEVALEGDYISRDDWAMQIGLRGSHNKIIPRELTFGSRVLVCSNMCFHGELGHIQTRQTLNAMDRLPGLIDQAVAQVPLMANRNKERFDMYRMFDMTANDGDAALAALFRQGTLTAAQLGKALVEWAEPSHDEHAEDGMTAWRLFNAATESLKSSNSMPLIQARSEQVSSFMDTVAL